MIPILEDIGVPISAIPKAIREIQKLPEKYGVKLATFGHVGDGNLHAVFVGDPTDRKQWDGVKLLAEELVDIALKYNGTISAEHGIGISKSPFVRRETGEVAHDVMKAIKKTLDPNNIMNPGKLGFDEKMDSVFSTWAYNELYESPVFTKSFGKDIDDEILVCVQCGFCRAGCPVFAKTDRESTIARGRIQQAYSMLVGRDVPEDEIADVFFTCTMCNFCQSVCPSGIKVTNVIQGLRSYFSREGKLPDVHKTALRSVVQNGNPFNEPRGKRKDFYPKTYSPHPEADTLLFLGCVASYQEFRLVPAIMGIMDTAGVRYKTLGDKENCCGFLNYLVGSGEREVMEKTKKAIDKMRPKTIVTTCAGCYRTLKDIYPKVLDGWDYEVVHAIDLMLDLAKQGKLNLLDFPKRVAYHDPCDLGRHMGMFDPPRELLNMVPGLELVEFPTNRENATCCGGGGGLKGFQNEMSLDIAYDRIKQAAEVEAQVVVSGCPTCKDNLAQAARRLSRDGGPRIMVMDIVELVKRSMGI